MSDIDEELLALAGDASSDEESDAPMSLSRSQSPASKAPAKSRSRGQSHDEGRATSRHSSPGSAASAPMDESASESEAETPDYEGARYPLEGKFKDEADRREIMALPEIQREQILAERADEQARDAQNRALRQLLRARQVRESQDKAERKRNADDAGMGSDDHRKTPRQRTKVGGGRVGESRSGIETLKKARDEKADRQRRRQENLDRNGGRRDRRDDSGDEGERSDIEWDEPAKRDAYSPPKPAEKADLADIESIRIGRDRFAKMAFYPGFEEASLGTFARVCIGEKKLGGGKTEQIYRMCEIVGFTEGRPYAMIKPNGQSFKIAEYIKAAHGKAQKNWPFITCSNSRFTIEEWDRYRETCALDGVKIPNRDQLKDKHDQINALEHRTWTDAEISERLRKQGLLNARTNMAGLPKYKEQLVIARQMGQMQKIEELEALIRDLEQPAKLAFGTTLVKKQQEAKESEQDRIARHNEMQRRKNNEEIKLAELRERAEIRKQEAALARGENVVVDHSRRVRTRAVLTHDVNNLTGSKDTKPPTPKEEKTEEVPAHIRKLQEEMNKKKAFGEMKKTLNDDDIIGAMDLDIEIEI